MATQRDTHTQIFNYFKIGRNTYMTNYKRKQKN